MNSIPTKVWLHDGKQDPHLVKLIGFLPAQDTDNSPMVLALYVDIHGYFQYTDSTHIRMVDPVNLNKPTK